MLDITPPAAPVLSTPADNASVIGTPSFTWLTAPTASKYQFEYATDAVFTNIIYTSAELTTLNHVPPTISLGTYYWHVRAKDAAGNWSNDWSTYRKISITPLAPVGVPTLLSPANSSIIPSPTPTMSWTAVTGAVNYQVQMDQNSTFSSPDLDSLTSSTNLTAGTLLADGVYYWRVRRVDAYGGLGAWSAVWRLSVNQPIPLAVTQLSGLSALSALSDTFDSDTPTFNWNSVEHGATYQIQVDDDNTFDTPSFDDTAATTTRIPPTPLSNGEYFWRVRAINIYETPGPWSETWTIVINVAPLAPQPSTPENEAIKTINTPTFEWDAVNNGASYQIQVDDNEEFDSPEFDDTAETTTRELVTPLKDGAYFWRVRAINIYDVQSAWSETQTVTIMIAPPLLTPKADATETTGTPTFTWDAMPEGVDYQIQVDSNDDFSSPEFDDTADTLSRTPVTPLANGVYQWRVRAITADDTPSEWSQPQIVTIAAP
jgi:predicted phage tail protein